MTASQSNFSQLKDFLFYLATIKGDLSNISAPPFLLSPKSVTEIPASWASHHDLFLQPARETDAARRALLVLKNFLCSLHHQLHRPIIESDSGPKKPLNAFLGELFIGEFGEETSPTRLVAEQVSHHPPVTACALYNRVHGILSRGYVAQETTFNPVSGVRVEQTGHAIVRDEKHGESHLRTLPTMTVKGLLSGHPYPELEGVCYISSSSGYLSTIEFTGKTSLGGGMKNSVRAELISVREEEGREEKGRKLFEVTGQWSGRLVIRDCVADMVLEEFDVADIPTSEARVKPLEEQSPWESRRAWAGVAEGIRAGDMKRVCAEKAEIEEAQRDIRRAEEMTDAKWSSVFFRAMNDSREFEVLAGAIPNAEARRLLQDRTAGVWEFVGADTAEAFISEGVYHRSLEPTGQIGI
ncbi:Oxysterol-binding protein [Xylaria bambusicola]|uniref:Oxysterol-binding protein n=1 Tax=Xylaria bambusicola TaxID=326684 RepID=UPI0020088B7D|nr:Oxysterol-binding protein [Xylaria bambusicola]KAI0509615.1 Oxysterol-binding protein [Xylaria bambusicola]